MAREHSVAHPTPSTALVYVQVRDPDRLVQNPSLLIW